MSKTSYKRTLTYDNQGRITESSLFAIYHEAVDIECTDTTVNETVTLYSPAGTTAVVLPAGSRETNAAALSSALTSSGNWAAHREGHRVYARALAHGKPTGSHVATTFRLLITALGEPPRLAQRLKISDYDADGNPAVVEKIDIFG